MLLAAAMIGQVVLLALAAAVVVVRGRTAHRPLIAWLACSSAYSYLESHWIANVLARMPRPYRGMARIALHASQSLYVLVAVTFVLVAWRAFAVRSRRAPLAPLAVLAMAMAALILGYGTSPIPGVYKIGSLSFGSAAVYTFAFAACTGLMWAGIVPGLLARSSAGRASSVTLATVVTFAVADSIRVVEPFAWSSASTWNLVPITNLATYMLAIGLHVAELSRGWAKRGATDSDGPELGAVAFAVAKLRVRYRIARTRWRGEIPDAAFRHDPTLLYPFTMAFARQLASPRMEDIIALAHVSQQGAAALETVFIVTGSLPPDIAPQVVAEAARRLAENASEPRKPFLAARTAPFVAAIEAAVRRVPREIALEVLGLARDLSAQAGTPLASDAQSSAMPAHPG